MRVFVSGATGFLGRHLARALVAHGWHVLALVRHPGRARILPEDGVTRVRGDLDNEQALCGALVGADLVIHLGAAMAGPWPVHQRITVEGTRRLLRLSAAAGVRRFVHVSSLIVYDKRGLAPGRTIDEDWRLVAPEPAAGAYARGKVEAEALVRQAQAQGGMEVVIVRPGLVYGPERVVFEHLGLVVGTRFVAVGGGDLRLPLVHVDSVVDALLRLATSPLAPGKVYQVVDENETTRADYLRLLGELTGQHHRAVYLPVWPVAATCGVIAAARRLTGATRLPDVSAAKIRARAVEGRYTTARLQADTGWQPRGPLRAGLARALGISLDEPKIAIERVGVIGAGRVADVHLAALRRLPGVRVTGLLDTDAQAAASTAARFGISGHFTDAERFYRDGRPQIVHILTPPQTHAALALDALRRSVHVLVEKPAVLTVAECDTLLEAARASGLTVGVDENFALDPLVQKARAAIARGTIGELVHISVLFAFDLRRGERRDASTESAWPFRLPGGPLEDLLPHPLSVVFALAGRELQPVHWRASATGRLPYEADDELRLSLADADLTAELAVSLSARPDDFVVTVYGTRATVRIDLQNMLLEVARLGPGPRAVARGARVFGSGLRTLSQVAGSALRLAARRTLPPGTPLHLIRAHYAALAGGRELPAPLCRARRAVEIARMIWPMPPSSPPADDCEIRPGPIRADPTYP